MSEQGRWRAKVAAWVHDPAEKAIVMLREAHEAGTVARLCGQLFGDDRVPGDLAGLVRTADRWASAADRPDFPRDRGEGKWWEQVCFSKSPVLTHPLSGEHYDLKPLVEEIGNIELFKSLSFDHLEKLIEKDDAGDIDWQRTYLAFWRLGPVLAAPDVAELWRLLPADTRIPDHSIWDHLKLVSAFAGALANDDTPALLSVSLGPVQSFIAQSRSTSDLWAGSHLLSRMAWEALEPVCERYGPDAVLFPDLHEVPLADRWLARKGVPLQRLPREPAWKRKRSDANPLFSATLPNRFLALVPASQLEEIVEAVRRSVSEWVQKQAHEAWRSIADAAAEWPGAADSPIVREQIAAQLSGFPELYWSAVPFDVVSWDRDGRLTGWEKLERALGQFHPVNGRKPGLFGTSAWSLRADKDQELDGVFFYRPNPGALYPAFHELVDRGMAAAKATRSFELARQEGYRCTLCGEREWLTTDRAHLERHTREKTLWAEVGAQGRGWLRPGERLCALCTLKRRWPRLFADEVSDILGDEERQRVQRYVVSTHTMALAPTLKKLAEGKPTDPKAWEVLKDRAQRSGSWAALPAGLVHHRERERVLEGERLDVARRLPARIDELRERLSSADGDDQARSEHQEIRRAVKQLTGADLEAYYALVLMDGDRLGAWLSAQPGPGEAFPSEPWRPSLSKVWHPEIRGRIQESLGAHAEIRELLEQPAPASPAYHVAISRALNGFSQHVGRAVVEECFLGKILYSGGDDLMAMIAASDLLSAMITLRCAYSGIFPVNDGEAAWQLLGVQDRARLRLGRGHVHQKGVGLLRVMGHRATASMGVVIAHHMAPLGAVLDELRQAEHRAKTRGDRDAFSISLMKRSGGLTRFTSKWGFSSAASSEVALGELRASPIGALIGLRRALTRGLSRRAIYHALSWLEGLPSVPDQEGAALSHDAYRELLERTLSAQFRRQTESAGQTDGTRRVSNEEIRELTRDLVSAALTYRGEDSVTKYLREAMTVAEFLARAGRGE